MGKKKHAHFVHSPKCALTKDMIVCKLVSKKQFVEHLMFLIFIFCMPSHCRRSSFEESLSNYIARDLWTYYLVSSSSSNFCIMFLLYLLWCSNMRQSLNAIKRGTPPPKKEKKSSMKALLHSISNVPQARMKTHTKEPTNICVPLPKW